MFKQTRNRHGVPERKFGAGMHTTKFGHRTSPLWRGGNYRTKCAVEAKSNPKNARAALSLGCLRHAQTHHEGHITPTAKEANPPVEANGNKVRVIRVDPHSEEVTLVRAERVAFRIPREERRVGDFCSHACLQLTHAPSDHVEQSVAETLTEIAGIRVSEAERALKDV